jgi:hypothetical protein
MQHTILSLIYDAAYLKNLGFSSKENPMCEHLTLQSKGRYRKYFINYMIVAVKSRPRSEQPYSCIKGFCRSAGKGYFPYITTVFYTITRPSGPSRPRFNFRGTITIFLCVNGDRSLLTPRNMIIISMKFAARQRVH